MYLGLDLRGGVHFLLQVDMKAALTKRLESLAGDMRSLLRDKSMRHAGIAREGQTLARALPRRRRRATRRATRIADAHARPRRSRDASDGADLLLIATLKPEAPEAHPGIRASSRTSPRCTTASTNWAWPSR